MSRHWLIQVLRFYRKESWRGVVACLILAVTTASALLKPWPLAWVFDLLFRNQTSTDTAAVWSQILVYSGYLVGLSLLHALAHAALHAVVISTGLRGLARVRNAVFDRLLKLSLRRLIGSQSGDLIYRATWDTYSFQTVLNQGLFTVLAALTGVVSMAVVLWQVNRMLTGVALVTVPMLVILIRLAGPQLSREANSAQKADASIASTVQQLVANLQLIQILNRERGETAAFSVKTAEALRARWRQHKVEIQYLTLVAIVLAGGTAAIIAVASKEVLEGRLTAGQMLIFLAYLAQLYEPLNQLSTVGGTLASARAGAERILDLLNESTESGDGTTEVPTEIGVSLEFDDVTFSYRPDCVVLNGLSLRLVAGETVAIIGPSGAGKSTFLQMIPRFLEPDSGQVRWNGVPLNTFRREALREKISLVLQEPLLFPATVGENIGFARKGATQAEIEAAAKAASAHDFITCLPDGYETLVGDGAPRLSTGEKQRINLARAFLRDAPVLLLDEPTSALDADSEQQVMAAVHRLAQGRTTLIVAHRLETLRRADRIIVIQNGRIEEEGRPEELLSASGYYARIIGARSSKKKSDYISLA